MAKTFNSKNFDVHSHEKDSVVLRDYTGDKDLISLKRAAPKRVKDFPGMGKTEVKLTHTSTSGELIGITTISTSLRADISAADRTDIKSTFRSVVADAIWDDLVDDQRLPYTV